MNSKIFYAHHVLSVLQNNTIFLIFFTCLCSVGTAMRFRYICRLVKENFILFSLHLIFADRLVVFIRIVVEIIKLPEKFINMWRLIEKLFCKRRYFITNCRCFVYWFLFKYFSDTREYIITIDQHGFVIDHIFVIKWLAVSYTHLTLPTIYSV